MLKEFCILDTNDKWVSPTTGYAYGCRCSKCGPAGRKATKLRRAGHGGFTSVQPVADLLTRLKDEGWTDQSLADCIGNIQSGEVCRLRRGIPSRIRKVTAQRILQAKFDVMRPTTIVPIIGSRRRVQALMRMGWSIRDISDATGVKYMTIHNLIDTSGRDRKGVQLRLHEIIREHYEKVSGTVGSSTRSRNIAIQKVWAPPLAWDDIDDPEEEPKF